MSHRNHSAPTLGCDFILIRHPTAYIRHHKETRMGSLRLHLICLMGANDFVDLSGEGGDDSGTAPITPDTPVIEYESADDVEY